MGVASSSRRKWLRRAGLIVGLVWVGFAVFWSVAFNSGVGVGENLFLVPGLIMFGSIVIAWKGQFIGGVILIVGGLFLVLLSIASILTVPPEEFSSMMLPSILFGILFGLLPLVSGVLFLLSLEGRGNHQK